MEFSKVFGVGKTFPRIASILFTLFWTCIETTSAHDCDKYCYKDCSDYFPGSEFSTCVSANVHCSCETKFSIKNPFVIFGIIVACFIGILCFCVCYRKWVHEGVPRHTVVAAPVIPSTGAGYRTSYGNSYQPNSTSFTPAYPVVATPASVNQGLVQNPPTEYMPPPAYNECVQNGQSGYRFSRY